MSKPIYLMFIRHEVSLENRVHQWKFGQRLYQDFLRAYSRDPKSDQSIELATRVRTLYSLPYSDRDMPLHNTGQIAQTGKRLSRLFPTPDLVYVSPYRRTRQTLTCLQDSWKGLYGKRVIVDERLCERNYGMAHSFFDRRVFQTLYNGETKERYPGGESDAEMKGRLLQWLHEIESMHARILVISHYEAIRTARSVLVESGVPGSDHGVVAKNCGISLYEPQGLSWKECFYNTQLS